MFLHNKFIKVRQGKVHQHVSVPFRVDCHHVAIFTFEKKQDQLYHERTWHTTQLPVLNGEGFCEEYVGCFHSNTESSVN